MSGSTARLAILLILISLVLFLLSYDLLRPRVKSKLNLTKPVNKIFLLMAVIVVFNLGQALWILGERRNPYFPIPGDNYRIKRRGFSSFNEMSRDIGSLEYTQNVFMELDEYTSEPTLYVPQKTKTFISGDYESRLVAIVDTENIKPSGYLDGVSLDNLWALEKPVPTKEGIVYGTLRKTDSMGISWRIFMKDKEATELILVASQDKDKTIWNFVDLRLLKTKAAQDIKR